MFLFGPPTHGLGFNVHYVSHMVAWALQVSTFAASDARVDREKSLLGQLVTTAWVIRGINHERASRGEVVKAPSHMVVTISAGSKVYPSRIDRFLVLLDPEGAAWKALVDFG